MSYSFLCRSQRKTQPKRISSATINDETTDEKGEFQYRKMFVLALIFFFFILFSSIDPLEIRNWNHLI